MVDAIRHQPAPLALARLSLTGEDAASFLQGYLTCNLDALSDDTALPMAYCNIKGRVLANGWAAGNPERVDLFVHESVAATLGQHLSKYLVFAQAKLQHHPEPLTTSAAAGGCELPPLDAFVPRRNSAAAAPPEAEDDLERRCIDAGFGVVSAPVSERFLPQMLGLADIGAVSFSKGCYLGQEVVARAQHRGEVKRRIARFRYRGTQPAAGAATSPSGMVIHAATDGGDCGVALAVTGASGAVLHGKGFDLQPV